MKYLILISMLLLLFITHGENTNSFDTQNFDTIDTMPVAEVPFQYSHKGDSQPTAL